MAKAKSLQDTPFSGKHTFVRVDFNVPFDEHGNISDDTRIVAALPTIEHIVQQGAKTILASHLGRPKGAKNPKYSLRPVGEALQKKLGRAVTFVDDCVGPQVRDAVSRMNDGDVLLLENVRFHPGEEKNDPEFARELASCAEAYVNDAFGSAHRAHASTAGVTAHLSPCVAGYLMEKELEFLGEKTANPEHPFVVVLGGAKVSDKIGVIDALLDKADTMLIGGAMAYTFALAQERRVGNSLTEPDKVETAREAISKARQKGVKLLLPQDTLATGKLDFDNARLGETKVVEGDIEDGWEGVDIGPKTISAFSQEISGARTILWNGPMGVFEIEASSRGTFAIAEAVAHSGATSIIGGGDSVKAIKSSGYAGHVSFISTGGGASLEFLEGKELPGVAALDRA